MGLFARLAPHAEDISLQEGCDGRGEKIPQIGDLNAGSMGRGELGDGEAPTLRQIGEEVGLPGTGSVSHQINRLEELGFLGRHDSGRGIALRW